MLSHGYGLNFYSDFDALYFRNLVLGDLFDDNKFSYSDLTIPDVDRTRFFLFTLINFYEFYKNRQVQIDRINEEMVGDRSNILSIILKNRKERSVTWKMKSHLLQMLRRI